MSVERFRMGRVRGNAGPQGIPGNAATVNVAGTETGLPGTQASVVNEGTASAAQLRFTIPRGQDGQPGADGTDGAPGTPGTPGQAASVSVGTTSTGAAGTNANVTQRGTAIDRIFDFTIPRGERGEPGGLGEIIEFNQWTGTNGFSVSAQVTGIFTDATGPRMTRVGPLVTLDIPNNKANGAITTAQNYMTIPLGFRPVQAYTSWAVAAPAGMRFIVSAASGTARSTVRPTVNIANTNNDQRVSMMWLTADDYP